MLLFAMYSCLIDKLVGSVAAGPSVNGTLMIEINCEILLNYFLK